jgi:hypothetical protein
MRRFIIDTFTLDPPPSAPIDDHVPTQDEIDKVDAAIAAALKELEEEGG